MSFTNLDSEKDKINEVLTNNELTQINLNLYNVIKSVCKIIIKDGKIGTGFFIKLYKNNREFFCIMTNEHIITQELINSNKKIIVYYDAQNERIDINLNIKERFIKEYKEFDLDITIIEILKEDNIDKKYFLLPYLDEYTNLINENIYIVQFPNGDLSYSKGKIIKIDKFEITHDVLTKSGSSGSPIFLENTTRVIGIHKQGNKNKKINHGNFLYPIIQALESNSEIKLLNDTNSKEEKGKIEIYEKKKISLIKNMEKI